MSEGKIVKEPGDFDLFVTEIIINNLRKTLENKFSEKKISETLVSDMIKDFESK